MKSEYKLLRVFSLSVLLGLQFLFLLSPSLTNAQSVPDALRPNQEIGSLPKYNSGVDKTIEQYLCSPTGQGTDLVRCVDRLYRFGITAGAITVVLLIVVAGYMYITGGEKGKTGGKNLVFSAITGIGILLGSYLLLNFINPDLVAIKPIQTPIFKSQPLPSCEQVGLGIDCVSSSGQVNYGGKSGSAKESQYKDLIAKYASQNGLDYCMLSALIQKESSFNKLIVSNPPPREVDPSQSPPSYNVSFSGAGHGIGLTQIFIFKGSQTRDGGEFGMPKKLTVQDLIDPETNIKGGAHFFGKLVKERNKNLREAYDDYQAGRGGNSNPATLTKYLDMYNACLRR